MAGSLPAVGCSGVSAVECDAAGAQEAGGGVIGANPHAPTAALSGIAQELDALSASLAKTERDLVPVELEYEKFMADHEIGMWTAYVNDGAKLPPEKLRERLGHQAMPAELYGRYVALSKSRKRMEKRIGALKAAADAQRSILSALKAEMEASR